MARRRCASFLAAGLLLFAGAPVAAEGASLGARLEAEAWWGLRTQDGALSLARMTLLPSVRPRLADNLAVDLRVRAEFAPDRTGLGAREGFAPWSRPVALADGVRLELDRATIQLRGGSTRLTLGKQVFAWGVLDGVPVTDRFDPVRRRDFVATEIRPERIGRWAVRAQAELHGFGLDAAFVPDPTVSQQAAAGDAFAVQAPRFRAGLPAGVQPAALQFDRRDRALADASYGLRVTRRFGRLDAMLLAFRGPETDPLLLPARDGDPGAVRLAFPHRTVIGGALVLPLGATVWRLEAAHIPDQPLNLDAPETGMLAVVHRPRTLLGLGSDWQAPLGLFVNAQLVIDRVSPGPYRLAHTDTDVLATLRVHRDVARDTVRLRGEILANLADGDFLARPAVEWTVSDRLTLVAGADLFGGTRDGIFGQFRDQDRLWLKVRTVF